jgi:Ca-activated chloride channel homolog
MNRRKKPGLRTALLSAAVLAAAPLAAQSASITQIDSSRLMAFQRNRLYVRALDSGGRVLEDMDLGGVEVQESADGAHFVKAGDPRIVRAAAKYQGISFLFLIDNSGSMYRDMDGKPAKNPQATRAYGAKSAASDFLLAITSSKDSVGMASFNTRYELLEEPSRDVRRSGPAMDRISEPTGDEGYTELYGSIVMATRDLGLSSGRKALVVLSDGENYSFFKESARPSPVFGERTYEASESLDEAVKQGVTVFAVHFGTEKDDKLSEIARKSGGDVFDARNSAELANIYATIRDNIRKEALLEYKASMFPGDKRWVRLAKKGSSPRAGALDSDRYYYSGTVFGSSYEGLGPWLLLLMLLALAFPLVVSLIKFEKPSVSANLALLYAPGAGRGTKVFAVGNRTVIGSDATADITLAGNTRLEKSPVTIVKDSATGRFTLVSDEAITVNNRNVSRKTLEPGDVINFNGTIAVFDDMDLDPAKKTSTSTRTWSKDSPRKKKG